MPPRSDRGLRQTARIVLKELQPSNLLNRKVRKELRKVRHEQLCELSKDNSKHTVKKLCAPCC
jgi:hypothetical protein